MKSASLKIRSPSDSELNMVQAIRAECATDLLTRFGEGHWGWTPTLKWVQEETKSKKVYVVLQERHVVGTFSISLTPPPFFDLERFRNPKNPAAYLTGLAVNPKLQRHGIGTFCMEQAAILAVEFGCCALRFDAYDHAAGAAPFYKKLGYQSRGKLIVGTVPLILFEKILKRK